MRREGDARLRRLQALVVVVVVEVPSNVDPDLVLVPLHGHIAAVVHAGVGWA